MLSVRTDAYLDAYEIKITRKNGPVDACTLRTGPTRCRDLSPVSNDSVLPWFCPTSFCPSGFEFDHASRFTFQSDSVSPSNAQTKKREAFVSCGGTDSWGLGSQSSSIQ